MSNKYENQIKLFGAVVLDKGQKKGFNTSIIQRGVVTNFTANVEQTAAIKSLFETINVTTLFSRDERLNSDPYELIVKQILHYIEIYGLDTPGLFDLEVTKGKILPVRFIQGISKKELQEKMDELLYSNRPVNDAELVKSVIEENALKYEIAKIQNNEIRCVLFDAASDKFANGDDAVRYIVYKTTKDCMLIKSDQVLKGVVTNGALVSPKFLENHINELAAVFNRHKRIILSLKSKKNRPVINKISKLSKTLHVPIVEAINKKFISLALNGKIDVKKTLAKIDVRDKLKYLNLLEYKLAGHDFDIFNIRNGKIHREDDRKVYDQKTIHLVMADILESLKKDLKHLKKANILLDKNVDFGLPVSRKQTIGRVPFGTRVCVGVGKHISSGVFWKNSWGSRDLDLSSIDLSGERTGWGQMSGYDNNNVVFSGDMTDAPEPKGAMEFLTSQRGSYGLNVNIYNGDLNTTFELVVGDTDNKKDKWMNNVIFREKDTLKSKGNIVGFVQDNIFTVYKGRGEASRISSPTEKIMGTINYGMTKFWTVAKLLEYLEIEFDTEKSAKKYDHDLSYDGFQYDKLEKMLLTK